MKRDLSLIRALMISIEEKLEPGEVLSHVEVPENASPGTILEHLRLMVAGDLIEGEVSVQDGLIIIKAITWKGHDFLDAVRQDAVWRKLLGKAKELGISLTVDLAKEWGKRFLSEMLTA